MYADSCSHELHVLSKGNFKKNYYFLINKKYVLYHLDNIMPFFCEKKNVGISWRADYIVPPQGFDIHHFGSPHIQQLVIKVSSPATTFPYICFVSSIWQPRAIYTIGLCMWHSSPPYGNRRGNNASTKREQTTGLISWSAWPTSTQVLEMNGIGRGKCQCSVYKQVIQEPNKYFSKYGAF